MTKNPPHHILIFEPDERGHAREWFEHLANFAAERHPDVKVTLAVPRSLASALDIPSSIVVETLTGEEEKKSLHHKLAVSGMGRWNAMQTHLASSGADYGFFLGLDHITLPLALGLRGRRPVSGILFRPSAHYEDSAAAKASPPERIRDLRKKLLYALMLRNPALDIVFSLDPYFLSTISGSKVRGLVDPAFPLPKASILTGTAVEPPPGRIVFLLFGEISERKGLLALFDALKRLDTQIAERVAVLIAGRIDPALRDVAVTRSAELRSALPLWLTFDDRFLPSEDLAALVRRADVVLAPYQRFVGSSGVMLWAASARKPIITQDYGLIGRLTRDHGLGLAIDTTDADALASAMTGAVVHGAQALAEEDAMATFAAHRTPHRFAATIFDGVLKRDASKNEPKRIPEMQQTRTGHASSLR